MLLFASQAANSLSVFKISYKSGMKAVSLQRKSGYSLVLNFLAVNFVSSTLLVSALLGLVPPLLQSFAIELSQTGLKIASVSHGVLGD